MKKIHNVFLCLCAFLGVSLLQGQAWTATESQNVKARFTDEEIVNLQKKFKDGSKRSPANTAVLTDEALSPAFRTFRDKYFEATSKDKVDTADKLDKMLDELNANYESYPADLKYVAAQLILLKPLRSIVYRLVPIFDPLEDKVAHTYALTFIKNIASFNETYFPTDQWRAWFDYMTVPAVNAGDQFKSILDFQAYLVSRFYSSALAAGDRLAAIVKNIGPEQKLAFDRKLFYGPASFEDNIDRYRQLGSAELWGVLAALELAIHNVLVWSAYNQNDIFSVWKDLGKLAWEDGFIFNSQIDGVTSKDRTKIIRKDKYKNFLTLNKDIGKTGKTGSSAMLLALNHLRDAIKYGEIAWLDILDDPDFETSILKPGSFRSHQRKTGLRFETWKDLVKGKTALRNVFAKDEVVTVDMTAFYTQPPEDIKALLPEKFDEGDKFKKILVAGKQVKYRNYYRGRAMAWNLAKFTNYIPSATENQKPDYIATASRVIRHSWAGMLLAWPLDLIVR